MPESNTDPAPDTRPRCGGLPGHPDVMPKEEGVRTRWMCTGCADCDLPDTGWTQGRTQPISDGIVMVAFERGAERSWVDEGIVRAIRAESAVALQEARATADHWHEMDRMSTTRAEVAEGEAREARERADESADKWIGAVRMLRAAEAEVVALRERLAASEEFRAEWESRAWEAARPLDALRDDNERLRGALVEVSRLAYESVMGTPISTHHRAFGSIVQTVDAALASAASRPLPADPSSEIVAEQREWADSGEDRASDPRAPWGAIPTRDLMLEIEAAEPDVSRMGAWRVLWWRHSDAPAPAAPVSDRLNEEK